MGHPEEQKEIEARGSSAGMPRQAIASWFCKTHPPENDLDSTRRNVGHCSHGSWVTKLFHLILFENFIFSVLIFKFKKLELLLSLSKKM